MQDLLPARLTLVSDVTDEMITHDDYITLGRKTKKYDHTRDYITAACGFDIETTKIKTPERELSFMYIWQFAINNYIIIGRTWPEFVGLINRIIKINHLNDKRRLIIWDANLGYEFSFFCKWFDISEMFAKTSRHPITCTINGCIEFRDALSITNTSLRKLAKMYTVTQKTNDLDYTMIRNSKTKLTEKEMLYCINDVRILAEFAIVMFNEYILKYRYIPITASNLIRRKIKRRIKNKQKMQFIIGSQFPGLKEYELMINYLFRGGVSHSNAIYVDMPIVDDHLEIRDFTSSYPAVMLQKYVPVSNFKTVIDDFHNYLNTHCCKILLKLTHVVSKTTHSLESKNKILDYSNDAVFDNGRLHSADYIVVYLTELDYANYQRYYNFEVDTVYKCEIATRGYLPEYLTKSLADDYTLKNKLKTELKTSGIDPDTVPEYARVKADINTYYGVCVTRMHMMQDVYDNDKGWDCIRNFDYKKEVEKAFLLPQWGIWVTAHARYNLMQCIADITEIAGNVVMQYDTDSIILKRNKTTDKYFDGYNEKIYKANAAVCDRLGLDYDIFYNLGEWDVKCHPTKIKCMGAKRYIYTKENGSIVTTIAGLPKKALNDLCNDTGKDPYNVFENKMHFGVDTSQKLRVDYIDEPTSFEIMDYQGNLETMHEKTSCVLTETEFQMNITPEFLDYYTHIKENYRRAII